MFFSKLFVLALAATGASAFIFGVQPFTGTFNPTSTSTFPVTFITASTMVEFIDLTVSFGISTSAQHTTSTTLGVPVANFDLVALGHSSTGPGNFTLNVPLATSDFSGPGSYVLTAAVLRGTGATQVISFRADPFSVTFNAS